MEESVGVGIMDIVVGAGIILGLLMGIAAVVVKMTANTKDDEVFAKVKRFIDPILAALRGSKGSPKG